MPPGKGMPGGGAPKGIPGGTIPGGGSIPGGIPDKGVTTAMADLLQKCQKLETRRDPNHTMLTKGEVSNNN